MEIEDSTKASYYKNRIKNTSNDLNSFLEQVGRTYLGKAISESEFKITSDTIVEMLCITNEDEIFDLGCANGLITYKVAKYAKNVTGFDLNEDLLTIAIKNHRRYNINYKHSDIMDIDFTKYSARKFYMHAVLQYFEYKMLRILLQKMLKLNGSFILYIADIPDQEKLLSFYDTRDRRDFLFRELIENKKSHLGNWWYKEHIIHICETLNLSVDIKDQNPNLQTAYYRFDAVIYK